jgi:drug/metabolite transporter (DMT)-like permease
MGSLVILPLAWREYRTLGKRGIRLSGKDFLWWLGLGIILCLGVNLQQIGLITTTVSNAGFLTALYVPLVPVLGWLIYRERIHAAVWPAVLGCVLGTYLLSNGALGALNRGDCWVLLSAVFWGVHVILIGRIAQRTQSPVLVAFAQFVVCGALSWIPAVATETIRLDGLLSASPTILYGGLLSVGIAYTLQVVAQRYTSPTDAAILLSSELLFAAIAGAIVLGDRLSVLQLAGGALIFVSILAVQLLPMLLAPARSGQSV